MSTRLIFLVVALGLTQQVVAQQTLPQRFKALSGPEKCWVICHPFIAAKAARTTQDVQQTALAMQSDTSLDGDANGGQVDAFRHSYWMAVLASETRWRAARRLGIAHERGNKRQARKGLLEDGGLADAAAGEMDLYNNNIGIQIAKSNPNASREELKQLVIAAILNAEMLVIRKNAAGQSLDCDGNIVPKNQWEGSWENNRCLVPSAE